MEILFFEETLLLLCILEE